MTLLVPALFILVSAIVATSVILTIRQFGSQALAIRGQLRACDRTVPLRVTFGQRQIRRLDFAGARQRLLPRPTNGPARLRPIAVASVRRASLISRGVSQTVSLAASQIAGEIRQVARLSYGPGFTPPRRLPA